MFPVSFARRVVARYCPADGAVLDPFCGRGTVPFVATATGRLSLGIDLNPVAYVYSSVKTNPVINPQRLLTRLEEVARDVRSRDRLPQNEFQRWAWCQEALGFLRAARRRLNWRESRIDRALMAILLVHLHGKIGNAISNQMRQSKGMSPSYAVAWWKERKMGPPDIDPIRYFSDKITWRYAKGVVAGPSAQIVLGDARTALKRFSGLGYSMLLTSPPYFGVTNYRVDNWIRLWMLGDSPLPKWEYSQRYAHAERYVELLEDVFRAAKKCLKKDAAIYVRTDAREFARDTTIEVLTKLWPKHARFYKNETDLISQTRLFGDHSKKPGETDILLLPEGSPRPRDFHKLG